MLDTQQSPSVSNLSCMAEQRDAQDSRGVQKGGSETMRVILLAGLLLMPLSAQAQRPYHGYPVQAGDGQYGDDTPGDYIPFYCRWGWSKCGPNGNIRRYHTREHCMAIPEDCQY